MKGRIYLERIRVPTAQVLQLNQGETSEQSIIGRTTNPKAVQFQTGNTITRTGSSKKLIEQLREVRNRDGVTRLKDEQGPVLIRPNR